MDFAGPEDYSMGQEERSQAGHGPMTNLNSAVDDAGATDFLAQIEEGEIITWSELSRLHKTRNGIFQTQGVLRSLLTDLGKISKCYPDVEADGGNILLYTGSGRRGDQKLDIRNRALQDAIRSGVAVPLFCKLAVNQWKYMGLWKVADCEYVFEDSNKRMIWRFVLKAIPETGK